MDPAAATLRFLFLGAGALGLSLAALLPGAPWVLQLPFGIVFSGALALVLLAPLSVRDGRPWLAAMAGVLAGAATAGSLGVLGRTLWVWGDPRFSQPTPQHFFAMALFALAATGAAVWFLFRHVRAGRGLIFAAFSTALLVAFLPALYGWTLVAAHAALLTGLLRMRRTRIEILRAGGIAGSLVAASFLLVVALDGEVRERGVILGEPGASALLAGSLAGLGSGLLALLFWRDDGWRVRGTAGEA